MEEKILSTWASQAVILDPSDRSDGQQSAPFARLLVRLSSRRVGCLSESEFELARSDFDFDELAR